MSAIFIEVDAFPLLSYLSYRKKEGHLKKPKEDIDLAGIVQYYTRSFSLAIMYSYCVSNIYVTVI